MPVAVDTPLKITEDDGRTYTLVLPKGQLVPIELMATVLSPAEEDRQEKKEE